ncbi:hypothetical protein BC938DRAFT_477158 [Jimgerdemannia flammicorona]|uniref:Uncharacterized protein n=1 Tax=Jimgerdemannia flammicorona TaxID=994334 RepID=A0A433PBN3_9FUNG|nr:hypothetical protein BC938DRAFT_477158 [Jimgerdemannia flammicorona]
MTLQKRNAHLRVYIRTIHGNGAHSVLTQVLSNLQHKTTTLMVLNLKGVQDSWEIRGVELHVDNGTDDGTDVTGVFRLGRIVADWCSEVNGLEMSILTNWGPLYDDG